MPRRLGGPQLARRSRLPVGAKRSLLRVTGGAAYAPTPALTRLPRPPSQPDPPANDSACLPDTGQRDSAARQRGPVSAFPHLATTSCGPPSYVTLPVVLRTGRPIRRGAFRQQASWVVGFGLRDLSRPPIRVCEDGCPLVGQSRTNDRHAVLDVCQQRFLRRFSLQHCQHLAREPRDRSQSQD